MNPFEYQGPVRPERLVDRREELRALQEAAADRVAIRLAAPRRFGKSSLLEAHVASMRDAGHRAVRVDLGRVATVADVAARLTVAFADLPGDPRRTVRRWAARLGLKLAAGGVGLEVAARPADVPADLARTALLELLDLPRRAHEADGGLTVVCFDELQDVLTADDGLDGLIRSVIQHHGPAAAYVFAGSQPSLMRALFSDRERPFYGQARPLELPPLPSDEAADDIERLLRVEGLDPGDAVDELLHLTAGHPQRTMLLAHHLLRVLEQGADPADAARQALDRAVAETRDAHQAVWDALGRPERIVLTAIADGLAPTGSKVAEEHRIPRSTLQQALARLVAQEQHVHRAGGGPPRLLDPLLVVWLRRR